MSLTSDNATLDLVVRKGRESEDGTAWPKPLRNAATLGPLASWWLRVREKETLTVPFVIATQNILNSYFVNKIVYDIKEV